MPASPFPGCRGSARQLDRGNTLRRPTCVHWVGRDRTGASLNVAVAGSLVLYRLTGLV